MVAFTGWVKSPAVPAPPSMDSGPLFEPTRYDERAPLRGAPPYGPSVPGYRFRVTEHGRPTEPQTPGGTGRLVRHPVRRTPNFLRFAITGAVIGFVVGALVATNSYDAPGYSQRTGIALIGGILAAIGALVGVAAGLVLEKLLNRS